MNKQPTPGLKKLTKANSRHYRLGAGGKHLVRDEKKPNRKYKVEGEK